MKKYIAIFSILAFLLSGSVSAEGKEWISGNFKYEKTENGIKVTQIHTPAQTQLKQQNLSQRTPPQNTRNQVQPTQPEAQQPEQQTPDIVSITPISDVNVDYGSDLSSTNLPATITVIMSDDTTQDITVAWDGGTPEYDGNIAGTYVFFGVLTLPENITNTNDVKASINVIVQEQPQVQPEESSPILDILEEATAGLLDATSEFISFILSPFKHIINR